MLDVGCADLKLRHYFRGNYTGFDLEKPKSWRNKSKTGDSFVVGDIAAPSGMLLLQCFPLAIATHIFVHVPPAEKDHRAREYVAPDRGRRCLHSSFDGE